MSVLPFLSPDIPCAVILTAIPVEYRAVRAHLTELKEHTHPEGSIYEVGKFKIGKIPLDRLSWQVAIAEIGAGNVDAAIETKRAIDYFKPEVLLFVGVAGGIKDVQLGDVVAATKVYGYESGKVIEEAFLPRPDVSQVSYRLEQRAKAEARKDDWLQRIKTNNSQFSPQAFVGALAAGEKVIASTNSEIYQRLRDNYSDALAVEMESHGVLKAVRANPKINALIVRGISNLIDKKSEADAARNQEIAAKHASAFAFQALAKLQLEEAEASRKTLFFGSILVTFVIILMRYFGMLQPLEFAAFDVLMGARPPEKQDKHVYIIGISNRDKIDGERISDNTLLKLIQEVNRYKPSVIGLDIYRDSPIGGSKEEYTELQKYLESSNNIIANCLVTPTDLKNSPGKKSPVDIDKFKQKVGFSDVLLDNNEVIRRHLLFLPINENSECSTNYSLSSRMAFNYLKSLNPPIKPERLDREGKTFKINNTIIKTLGNRPGVYQNPNKDFTSEGFQILLNYRAHEPGHEPFKTFLSSDFLNNPSSSNTNEFTNRVVIIGYISSDINLNRDVHLTPYSYYDNKKIPGVIIQAHMVSQIINAAHVEENRPLLLFYPAWIEALSILIWASIVLWYYRSIPKLLLIGVFGSISVQIIFCFVLISKFAIWFPLVPPVLTVIFVMLFNRGILPRIKSQVQTTR